MLADEYDEIIELKAQGFDYAFIVYVNNWSEIIGVKKENFDKSVRAYSIAPREIVEIIELSKSNDELKKLIK